MGAVQASYQATGCIALFAQTPFDKVLGSSNLKMLKYEWIWEKTESTGFLNAKKMPLKAHENILIFYNKPPTYNPQFTYDGKPYKYEKSRISSSNYGNSSGTNGVIENDGRRVSKINYTVQKGQAENGSASYPEALALIEYLILTYTKGGYHT